MKTLLSTSHKLDLCQAHGYLAKGLHLLPGNKSGAEFCDDRGACFATCLDTSGRGLFPGVIAARMDRSRLWLDDPDRFQDMLWSELEKLERAAARKGLRPACRLNALSDLAWERLLPCVFADHPGVQFYDYTKSVSRAGQSLENRHWPSNYSLTYSWSEKSTGTFGAPYLRAGGRIALVNRGVGLAKDALDRGKLVLAAKDIVDGDEHDLTFLHPPGSILVLKPKGALRKKETVFA